MDWFNSICGVVTLASGAAAIAQYFKIKGIRERDYNDALSIALKAQEVIAHTDDVKVAYRGTQPDVQRQLPPALQEHLFQASAILPDLIQRCGDSLNLTHHKEFDKHYQQLKDDEIIHGHLLRTIDGKRPHAVPVQPPVRITSPLHGEKVDFKQLVETWFHHHTLFFC